MCNTIFTQKIKSKSSGRTQFIGDTEEGLWFSDAKIWNRRSEIFVQCVSIRPFIAKGTIINKRVEKVKLIIFNGRFYTRLEEAVNMFECYTPGCDSQVN